jgi:hypothetical protein
MRVVSKMKKVKTRAWPRLGEYSSHKKYIKKEAFWGDASTEQRKILTCTSLPRCSFESLNPCPQPIEEGPQFAESTMQVAILAATQNTLDLYRPATGLG